jgi:tRNA 2-thiouridine synthesizing protein A
MSEYVLNAKNLLCPLPVIRTQQKVKELQSGDILEVTATDPGVLHDIPAWCRVHGHEVIEIKQVEKEIWVRIKIVNIT